MDICSHLKQHIDRRGFSIRAFAKQCETSYEHMRRVVQGTQRPGPELADRIEHETNGEISAALLLLEQVRLNAAATYRRTSPEGFTANCSQGQQS